MLTALALLLLAQTVPQDEKKPAPEAPQEEKKPVPEKPEDLPPPQEEPFVDETWLLHVQADVRIGGWRTESFRATTPMGQRKIESTLLFDAGLDLRALYSGWSLSLTGDYASNKSLTLQTGGVLVGLDLELAPETLPVDLQIAIGPIFGRLDVDQADFGDFKSAVGFELRLAATSWIYDRVGVSLWADFREIRFKYEEPVTAGESRAGGPSFAVGAGLVMRF